MRLPLPILLAAGAVALAAVAGARGAWRRGPTPPETTPAGDRVIVAFGDSITEGIGGPGSIRWPEVLAARLRAAGRPIPVINRGVSGNRLLRDTVGPAGLARFDHDVLAQPGVAWVTILIGINDLGFFGAADPDAPPVIAEQLIAGYQQLVRQARARGVKVYGCTLLPFEGAEGGFYTQEKEATRVAVNAWIRSAGAFDAVIDFDQGMRDPTHPARLLPRHDSGDHLHPGDRGQQAMGEAVPLRLFGGD